ncbi:MAG: autotransporter domain-containing protein, partial [Alphaproteobacteria bacterium]|nr:autotransporter domain-containing protein [Alphaproteobacteria bacterium]
MSHYSKTTLRELKKRYLNILKKCFLANLMAFSFILPVQAETTEPTLTPSEELETVTKDSTNFSRTEITENTTIDLEGKNLTYTGIESSSNGGVFYVNSKKNLEFINSSETTDPLLLFENNKTSSYGGAIYNNSTSVSINNATFGGIITDPETGTITSQGNQAKQGGAIYNAGGSKNGEEITYGMILGNASFIGNTTSEFGGAIYNTGYMKFTDEALFKENSSANGVSGAIYNAGFIMFDNDAQFFENSGGAIYNDQGGQIIFNGITTFNNNDCALDGAALGNFGTIMFTETSNVTFSGNSSMTGAITNYEGGKIVFDGTVTFDQGSRIQNEGVIEVNTEEVAFKGGRVMLFGGAIWNANMLSFSGTVNFGDIVEGVSYGNEAGIGGAIYNGQGGSITFGGASNFKGNSATGSAGPTWGDDVTEFGGGAIYNEKGATITFASGQIATFISNQGNTSSGGAIYNKGSLAFNGATQFMKNMAINGGAIYNSGTITFEDEVTFSGNSASTNGADIYNAGVIYFSHTQGTSSVEGGIYNNFATIVKDGAGTLVFKDSVINGGTGVFEQRAGVTQAHSEDLITWTNNIYGGTLETYGSVIGYTANIGDEGNANNKTANVIHHSTATGNNKTSLTTALKLGAGSTALFDSATSGIQANYILTDDMAGKGVVTFKDAKVNLSKSNYDGAYVMGENVTLDLQNWLLENVTFSNLTAQNTSLKIDATIMGDKLNTDMIISDPNNTFYLNLSDVVIIGPAFGGMDSGLNSTYTAQVVQNGTLNYASESGLVATDVYKYEVIGTEDNKGIKIQAIEFTDSGDVMQVVARYRGDAAFNMAIGGDSYEMQSDVTIERKTKSIVGKDKETSILTGKKITVNGATLNVENVTVTGDDQLIDVKVGKLLISDAKVDNVHNSAETTLSSAAEIGSLTNDADLIANTSTISLLTNNATAKITGGQAETVLNTGDLIADTSTIGMLTNDKTAQINGGKVTTLVNNNSLTIEGVEITELTNAKTAQIKEGVLGRLMNNNEAEITLASNTRAETVTNLGYLRANGSEMGASRNDGKMVLEGVTVSELRNLGELQDSGSNFTKLLNEKTADLSSSRVDDLVNTGTLTAKDLTIIGALRGEGVTILSGKVMGNEVVKSENKIISDGMVFSPDIQKAEFSDLDIKEGTTLDIGTREVTAKTVTVNEKAILGVTLNGVNDFGTMQADKVVAKTDAKVHLTLGGNFEGGVFDVFKGTEGAGDLEVIHNNIYDMIEVEEGKYVFMSKGTDKLQESLGVTKEEALIVEALTEGSTKHELFNRMQGEVLVALQSLDTGTVEKAKKALSAVGATAQPAAQSVSAEHVGAVIGVVSGEMKGGAMKGHSGGDEDPRAKVFIKGLYDKTKSTMGEGFKARSQGAVLGVQSKVTDALTVGVGYATSQTTAKEELRRTQADVNTGFISAHYQPNAWWMSGMATVSRGQYDEEKQVLSSKGTANYDVDSWGVQVMTGYDIKLDNMVVTPEVGLRYLSVKQEGYTDTLGTTVSATISNYLTALAGAKASWDLGKIRPTVGISVGYDVITDEVSAVNTLANGASYTVTGEALDRLSATVTTGLEAKVTDRTSLKLEYS